MDNLILKNPKKVATQVSKGIGEFFFEQAEIYGNKIFQIDAHNGNTETYLVVRNRSTKVAIYLQKMGIKPKDIVMICCQNNTNNIIPALGALYLGAYIASIDPKQTVSEVKNAISLVEPKVIFVEENSLPLVEKALDDKLNIKIIVIGKSDKYVKMQDMEEKTVEIKDFKPIRQKSTDTAAIVFSSGTTSAPKGICLSNAYIVNSCMRLVQHNQTKPGVFLHFSSLYWVSAWVLTGLAITTGSAKVVGSNIDAETFLKVIDKYKVTYLFTSNIYTYEITKLDKKVFEKYDTSSLYSICIGGSTMDPQQIINLRKILPHTYVALGYGSSEGNFLVCHDFTNQKAYEEKVSSSGTLVPETEMKIVDLETGKLLGPNKEGEIRVKSPYLMSGYYNYENPDTFDEDGFLRTGDIGYYDEDQYIYVTDRLSEMFKYKTNKISPSLLEHTFLSHPDVDEVVVFGVPHFLDRNHPAACVVLKSGRNTTKQELLDFINSKVSDAYQLRGGLMFVNEISKTPTGKIKRRAIRDSFIKSIKENSNV